MRTFIILFCTTMFSLSPSHMLSQNVWINIEHEQKMTVEQVFDLIAFQTEYKFIYQNNMFEGLPKVQLSKGKVRAGELLNKVLSTSNYTFSLSDDETTIILKVVEQQEITITGKVTDVNGMPLAGVTVFVTDMDSQNSQNQKDFIIRGTTTDFDGNYKINANPSKTFLVFSFVGYKTERVAIGSQKIINQILKEDVTELEAVEIISTGYQRISKERSAGSFSKPNMEIAKDRAYSMNVLQRIDGLVAGLTVNNSPGSENFLIRGLSSINSNRSPLIVVDGVPTNNIDFINPQDVEDITVLKDATAASIWGARASNGVVVLTTKKGEKDSKLKVSYDGFTNIQGRPDLAYQPFMKSSDFIRNAREVFNPEAYPYEQQSAYVFQGSGIPPHLQTMYDEYRGLISSDVANARLDSLSGINNRNQIDKLWYRQAMQTNHTLTLSAGGNSHTVYGSMTYTDTKSDRPGDSDKMYKINVRQDFTFNDKISSFLITDFTKTKAVTKNNLGVTYGSLPYQLYRDANGNNMSIPYMGMLSEEVRADFESRSQIDLNYNPLDERNFSDQLSDVLNARLIAGVNINIFDNIDFNGTYGYTTGSTRNSNYTSPESYIVRSELAQFTVADAPGDTPIYYLPSSGGRFAETNVLIKNYTIRNQLSYDKSWNDSMHQVYALIGQEAQEQLSEGTGSTVRGYDPFLLTSLPVNYEMLANEGVFNPVMPNFGSQSFLTNDSFSKSETISRFTSYYGNLSYTLNRKYTLNGSWRRDQSNLFGLDKSAQNKPTWSVGGKWSIGKENFLISSRALNTLDLRATYGITGNAPTPGISSSYDILRPQEDYAYVGNTVPLTIQTPGNPKLTWESTKTLNFGVDFGLFDAIFGSIDVYKKTTDDLLGQLSLNVLSGFSSSIGNFGSMENKGIELTLNTQNIQTENFSWNTLFTMAYNDNEITELLLPGEIASGDQKVNLNYIKGYPAFAIFAYDYQGLDAEGDPLIRLNDGTITKEANITNPEDVFFKGTSQPVWNGGLSNEFRYKDFNLSINAVYNLGHVMRKDVVNSFSGMLEGVPHQEFENRWKQPGDELITDIPAFNSEGNVITDVRDVDYYRKSNTNVLDASYVKLRDITLSYSIPKATLNKIKLDDLSLRLSVSNIMLWKANDYGIDPEFQINSFGVGYRGIRRNQGSVALGLHLSL